MSLATTNGLICILLRRCARTFLAPAMWAAFNTINLYLKPDPTTAALFMFHLLGGVLNNIFSLWIRTCLIVQNQKKMFYRKVCCFQLQIVRVCSWNSMIISPGTVSFHVEVSFGVIINPSVFAKGIHNDKWAFRSGIYGIR